MIPRWIEHQLYIGTLDGRNDTDLVPDVLSEYITHAAAGRRQGHLDLYDAPVVITALDAAFVDEAEFHDVDRNFGVVTSAQLLPDGRLYGDLTVTALGEEHFLLLGSGAAQEMHRRWFETHLPAEGVSYRNVTDDFHGLAIEIDGYPQLIRHTIKTVADVIAEALHLNAGTGQGDG